MNPTTVAPRPIVIVDVEATGLNEHRRDHIWEAAFIRHDPTGRTETVIQIQHDTSLATDLPAKFRDDHGRRYNPDTALTPGAAREAIRTVMAESPLFVGAVPSYDAALLAQFLGCQPWHYQLVCVENLTVGRLGHHIRGGLSGCLAALGLDANPGAHEALPDARAAERVYQHLMPMPTWSDATAEPTEWIA